MKNVPEEDQKDYKNHYRPQKSKILSFCTNYKFITDKMNSESSRNSLLNRIQIRKEEHHSRCLIKNREEFWCTEESTYFNCTFEHKQRCNSWET